LDLNQGDLNPDPHHGEKSYPGLHPDPHQRKIKSGSTAVSNQGDKLNPDPHPDPHQCDPDPQHWKRTH
jgi:hypothetical protein